MAKTKCYNVNYRNNRVLVTNLFVITGPSGVGKTTLVKLLLERHKHKVSHPLTYTTRDIRGGEVHGREMNFIPRCQWAPLANGQDVYLAHTEYDGNMYGTRNDEVTAALKAEKKVILVFDIGGVQMLREQGTAAKCLFMLPEKNGMLERNLLKRYKNKNDEGFKARLALAHEEERIFCNTPEIQNLYDGLIICTDNWGHNMAQLEYFMNLGEYGNPDEETKNAE